MKVAIVGCGHGELDRIYETIRIAERRQGIRVDLLLVCGDFQAVRNPGDLQSLAVPEKYRQLGDFYKYYSGECLAPILTLFVGGNHESSEFMYELPFGGWTAPRIYYLGYASVVKVNGIRIGGLSGIYKSHDYRRGHYETPPLTESTKRSIYHIREFEVFEMAQIQSNIDVIMSHDWPAGIHAYGDVGNLIRRKPHFRDEISSNTLGCPYLFNLCSKLRPKWWFAAHLHVKFAALMPHEQKSTDNPEAISLDDDEEEEEELQEKEVKDCMPFTRFLALSKVLPHSDFIQIIDIPTESEKKGESEHHDPVLEYDAEWLGILKQCYPLFPTERNYATLPLSSTEYLPTMESTEWVNCRLIEMNKSYRIPDNFARTAPSYNPDVHNTNERNTTFTGTNPQTLQLLQLLDLPDIRSLTGPSDDSGGLWEPVSSGVDIGEDSGHDQETFETEDASVNRAASKRPRMVLPPPKNS